MKIHNVRNYVQVLDPLKMKVKDFSVAKYKKIIGVV